MMKRVLVTGASGFLGRHCLPRLTANGFVVHALSRREGHSSIDSHARWHDLDLANTEQIAALIRDIRPTHLLHLAWYVEHGQFWSSLENLRCVTMSLELIRAFVENGGQRFVGAGTCAEYAWGDAPLSETATALLPTTLYGVSKAATFAHWQQLARQTNCSGAWGRIFHLYGPFEDPRRLVPFAIGSLLNGQETACTEGTQVRDFLFVEDAAAAFVELLDSELSGAVNIGSGTPVSIRQLLGTIGDKLQRSTLLRFGGQPMTPGDPPRIIPDVTRLTTELRWRPRTSLSVGLDTTIDWWINRRR